MRNTGLVFGSFSTHRYLKETTNGIRWAGTAAAGFLWLTVLRQTSDAGTQPDKCYNSCTGLKVWIPQPLTAVKTTAPSPGESLGPWPLELLVLLPISVSRPLPPLPLLCSSQTSASPTGRPVVPCDFLLLRVSHTLMPQ